MYGSLPKKHKNNQGPFVNIQNVTQADNGICQEGQFEPTNFTRQDDRIREAVNSFEAPSTSWMDPCYPGTDCNDCGGFAVPNPDVYSTLIMANGFADWAVQLVRAQNGLDNHVYGMSTSMCQSVRAIRRRYETR